MTWTTSSGWVEAIGEDVSGAEEETGCPLVTGCPPVIINAKGLEGGMVNDRLSARV